MARRIVQLEREKKEIEEVHEGVDARFREVEAANEGLRRQIEHLESEALEAPIILLMPLLAAAAYQFSFITL